MDYTLYLGEDVAAWLAAQPLQVGQLVWVCKSKGIKNKKKKKKNRHRQQEDHLRQHEHFQQQQRQQQQQEQELQQRIEPFLRARILSLDEEDEKLYEDNPKDDEKHKQIQHALDWNSTTTTTNENNNYKNNNTKKMGSDRVTVIYPKGSTYRVRRSHIWPILDPSWSYYPWLLLDSSSSVVVVSAETLPKSDLEQQQVDGALAVASTTTTTTTQNNLNSSSSSFWTNQVRTMDQTYNLSNNINNNSSTRVLVWPETNEYRRCCIQHTLLLPNMDFFVEVGCDYGTTVAKVASTLSHEDSSCSGSNNGCHEGRRHRHPSSNCCRVLGIDKSTESIAMAKQRYPHLLFVQWDLLDDNNNKSQGEDTTTAAAAMNQLQQNVKNQRNSHQAVDAVGPHDNDNTIPSSLTTTAFTTKSLALPLVAQYLLQLQQLWTTTTTTDTATNGTTRLHKCSNETTTSISSNDKDKNNQNEKENDDVDHDDDECLSSTPSSLVVAIDINGNRELEAVQQCLARVQSMWQPRLIIVKSRALHQYISQNS